MIRPSYALRWLLCGFLALALCSPLTAKGSKGSGKSGGEKTVHVREYTKKDGSHVRAHDRRPPGSGSSKPESAGSKASAAFSSSHSATNTSSATGERDENGKIKPSAAARREFMRSTGYPHGRPGYVVDHIVPLACGGTNATSNMQWQTIAAAEAKDKTERLGCR